MSRGLRLFWLLVVTAAPSVSLAAASEPPNIVFILADDLGYGDLGCYGQKLIQTPNLDALAAEGALFTQHYAGSTVCAPSRCVLMTGKHTGHAAIRGNRDVSPTSNQPLPAAEVTLAEALERRGYATALIGKWGLGDQHNEGSPNRQGFGYSFGYLSQSHAHNYFPEHLFRNGRRVALRNFVPAAFPSGAGVASVKVDYAPDRMLDEAEAWLERQRRGPFFLYFASTLPHANNEAGQRGLETPDFGRYRDADWPDSRKAYAAMVSRLDDAVGAIRKTLARLGLAENTLVVFTSDNGPHSEGGHDPTYFRSSGPLRGIKRDLYEGGVRAPTLAAWPGRIMPGRQCETISGFQDWLPTFAELAGAEAPGGLDGVSLVPSLTGVGAQRQHDYLYWEFHERGDARAIRSGDWKAVQRQAGRPRGPVELFDLSRDVAEQHDVAAAHPDVVARLERLMDEARTGATSESAPEAN